ncbi:nudix hydrolase 16, mitochondrial-like isoform X2 [Olea europaea var. sylvestris]|uniref:nudix hydrolase 16, mitochondrial-like isoform X2 n=1 Tax=Olea europaea var. sylvestris TaxID=158386 RepID=UPI000C1D30AD|nr:nudix hydrolase 16, mitochondrial-like isoform X2 [Olea europaea var. sylvestris]
MSELVARTGRQQQRYEDGFRLIAGCIPFKYGNVEGNVGDSSKKIIEVLMINSNSGPGLLFPKHFLGYYPFKSKTQLDEFSPEGWCKAAMYALLVKEELESWPEKSHRQRSWLTIPKAIDSCRHAWMRVALEKGFQNWYSEGMIHTLPKDVPKSSSNQR